MGDYRPASGTEGMDFEAKWCGGCSKDADAENGNGCPLLTLAYTGGQPDEWRIWRGEPVCDAFDGADYPHLSGFAVRDMFPGSHKRPTTGAQVRAMVGA